MPGAGFRRLCSGEGGSGLPGAGFRRVWSDEGGSGHGGASSGGKRLLVLAAELAVGRAKPWSGAGAARSGRMLPGFPPRRPTHPRPIAGSNWGVVVETSCNGVLTVELVVRARALASSRHARMYAVGSLSWSAIGPSCCSVSRVGDGHTLISGEVALARTWSRDGPQPIEPPLAMEVHSLALGFDKRWKGSVAMNTQYNLA